MKKISNCIKRKEHSEEERNNLEKRRIKRKRKEKGLKEREK